MCDLKTVVKAVLNFLPSIATIFDHRAADLFYVRDVMLGKSTNKGSYALQATVTKN